MLAPSGKVGRTAVLVVAALAVSGCSERAESRSAPAAVTTPVTTAAAVPWTDTAALPPPEVLADVMYRLADPAVPGADKLPLIEDSTPPEAAILDRFSAALRDGGYNPVSFTAADVQWAAGRNGPVLATVEVGTTNTANPGGFSFPMEFRAGPAGWQLTRATAEMLLPWQPES